MHYKKKFRKDNSGKPERKKKIADVRGQWVLGRIPVLEALRAGKRKPIRLFYQDSAVGLEDILAAAGHTPTQACTREMLDQRTAKQQHQGVLLEAAPLPLHDLETTLDLIPEPNPVLLLLDGVENPRNFGGIVRSAAAMGASAVIFGRDRSAPLSPAALKSAAGAMEYVPLVQVTNLARSMALLKDRDYWIVGLDADAPQTIWEAHLDGPVTLVVGNEGKGMRRLVADNCDFHAKIPIGGPISSLNASVSAALVLAECMRRRASAAKGGSPPHAPA